MQVRHRLPFSLIFPVLQCLMSADCTFCRRHGNCALERAVQRDLLCVSCSKRGVYYSQKGKYFTRQRAQTRWERGYGGAR